MFEKNDYYGGLVYKSKKTNIIYSLLDGVTSDKASSDITFIFRHTTPQEQENDNYYGDVIGWSYDGFHELDYVEKIILEYENNFINEHNEITYVDKEYPKGKAIALIKFIKKQMKDELHENNDNEIFITNMKDYINLIDELNELDENEIVTIKDCQMGGFTIVKEETKKIDIIKKELDALNEKNISLIGLEIVQEIEETPNKEKYNITTSEDIEKIYNIVKNVYLKSENIEIAKIVDVVIKNYKNIDDLSKWDIIEECEKMYV